MSVIPCKDKIAVTHWVGTFLLVAVVVLFWAGCKDEGPSDPEISDIIFPPSNVSYSGHVDALFQQRCAFSGCHAGANPQRGLDLLAPSYAALRNHLPALVVAGEPDNSLLVQILEGTIQPRMPFNRTPLTANQTEGIRTWINEGALNN
jgi:hypothetical protein